MAALGRCVKWYSAEDSRSLGSRWLLPMAAAVPSPAAQVTALLEAAHITPYLGPDTNSITNGLLLRADLHTLWDLGLIAVNPSTRMVWVSPSVNDPTYQALSGTILVHHAHLS